MNTYSQVNLLTKFSGVNKTIHLRCHGFTVASSDVETVIHTTKNKKCKAEESDRDQDMLWDSRLFEWISSVAFEQK